MEAHNTNGYSPSVTKKVTTPEEPNTPGTLTITPTTPQAGKGFTLKLKDPNGVRFTSFGWTDVDPNGASGGGDEPQSRSERSNTSSSSFSTPTLAVGKKIKGFVDYTDSFGPSQYASVLSNVVVAGLPTSPRNVDAARGDTKVTLSWTAPKDDRGAAVSRYDYNYKIDGGSWKSSDLNTTGTSVEISGLTNGSLYHFRVRPATPLAPATT